LNDETRSGTKGDKGACGGGGKEGTLRIHNESGENQEREHKTDELGKRRGDRKKGSL